MLNKDFYGKNGFVWWTGVVEDRDDPLKLGSVRVRIIGLHSENANLVPTDSLPWAQVLQPATGATTNAGPREGDWVFGFFQDGDYAQIPVVVGIFPGIESVQSQTIYNQVTIKKGAEKTPRPSQVDRVVGEPTTVRMSRGVMEGTLTNVLNQNLSHACDVKVGVETASAWIRIQNGQLIQSLVDTIKSLTALLGEDASGLISLAINTLKAIQAFLKPIQELAREIREWANVVNRIFTITRSVLDYINNLPSRLQQFLRECLSKVSTGILAIISSIFSVEGSSDFGFGELISEYGKTIDEFSKTGTELAKTVALPGQLIETLVNPSSPQDQEAAGKVIGGIIDNVSSNGEAINNQTQFKKTSNIP